MSVHLSFFEIPIILLLLESVLSKAMIVSGYRVSTKFVNAQSILLGV